MKLIKQSFEILEQEIPIRKISDSNLSYKNRYLEYMYKHIEKCGRVCYKSEDKITEDSAERFVKGLIKTKHYSVLEHGAVYLSFKSAEHINVYKRYANNPFSKVNTVTDYGAYDFITTNYRVIIENGWEEDLQYLCEPTKYHEKRHTVLLHSCIHVYKDLTRHRKASFSIESTRYCNYSKIDKFGEMKFVLPPWLDLKEGSYSNGKYLTKLGEQYLTASKDVRRFLLLLQSIELDYNELIELGWQPQQAAEILPQCTAADVIMSAYSSDWEFIFRLRSNIAETGKPHPLVEELMTPLMNEFKIRNYYYDTSNTSDFTS